MLSRRTVLSGSLALLPAFLPRFARADTGSRTFHALSLLGEPRYGPDFPHLDYVNPEAPKGGEVRLYGIGGFDNFNPFIVRGDPGPGWAYETLMTSTEDDPQAEYGLIAESIEVANDRSWIAFNLRPESRWHDGKPITAEDVIFSFDILKEKGTPTYRFYYGNVVRGEQVGERKVKFTFNTTENRELPQIMGQLPVLAKHYWEGRKFEEPSLDVPLGSGPYKLESFQAGRTVTLRRVPEYWGADLPINIGKNNWDVMRYDYYKDANIAFEAFKAGQYDFRQENSSKNWAVGYDIPAFREGRIIKDEIPIRLPTGMQGYVFNTRRDIFKDRRVREALGYAFDFAWTNKTLFYGLYVQADSYFFNSELASSGLPTGKELKILEKYRGRIPDEVFTKVFTLPKTDGSGNNRANLRKALEILKSAGWGIQDRKLTNLETGRVMSFEILLTDSAHERVALPFTQNLKRIGVDARIRLVDPAQYQNRIDAFDFDMIVDVFPQSLSPGNEQRWFWGSASADQRGGQNTIGIKDPVIDELIELVISAPDRESLIVRTHALDRVLLWGFYLIPQQRSTSLWVAYWNKFGRPERVPQYGVGFTSWWIDAEKVAKLGQQRTN